jgi:hypothetical protein
MAQTNAATLSTEPTTPRRKARTATNRTAASSSGLLEAARSALFHFGLPCLYVLLLPFLWTDSGATRYWEAMPIRDGFVARLLLPTILLVAVLAAQTWLLRRQGGRAREHGVTFAPRWNFWFWILVLGIFLLRAFEHFRLFPVTLMGHMGEMNHAILGASYVADGRPFTVYNLGLGLLFYPLFEWLGYSTLLSKQLTILLWGTIVLALFVLFSRLHGGVNSPLIFIPAALFCWILPSLRTYTWHVGAAVAAVAVYFLVAAIVTKGSARTRVVYAAIGVVLYLVGLSAYHAAVLFLPPLAVILVVSYAVGWRPDALAGRIVLVCLPLLAGAAGFVLQQEVAAPLQGRLQYELAKKAHIETWRWNPADNALRSWDNFFYSFLARDASPPMRVLFLTGICLCIRSFRTSVFKRTTLLLFLILYGVQWPLWGHGDWSQNCYTVIPILGILLVALRGLQNVLGLIRQRTAYAAAVGVLTAGIGIAEYEHYFDAGLFYDRHYKQDPYDTKTQLTMALRDVVETRKEDDDVVFFMPTLHGLKQPVSYNAQGLEWRNPRLRQVLEHVRFFNSPADLAARVQRVQARTGRPVRVYFGVPSADSLAEAKRYVEGLPGGAQLIREEPYRDVMQPHIALYLTYVDIPAPSAAPAGNVEAAPSK